MAENSGATLVYLDQNIFSDARRGQERRPEIIPQLMALQEQGIVFCYSATHLDECRASGRPETFVDILEELSAVYLEPVTASEHDVQLTSGLARDLLLAECDTAIRAQSVLEGLLKPIHFASGWLGPTQHKQLQDEMSEEMTAFGKTLIADIDWDLLGPDMEQVTRQAILGAGEAMLHQIEGLKFDEMRAQAQASSEGLRGRLPKNMAQLDQISDENVVSFIVERFDAQSRAAILEDYPMGFAAKQRNSDIEAIAGFAFTLFLSGLVRDNRVKKGALEKRQQHFLGQYRDCAHIGYATRCHHFLTFDGGAARLAKSIYHYAGIQTGVLKLDHRK